MLEAHHELKVVKPLQPPKGQVYNEYSIHVRA
jgi:hypothetical protein